MTNNVKIQFLNKINYFLKMENSIKNYSKSKIITLIELIVITTISIENLEIKI